MFLQTHPYGSLSIFLKLFEIEIVVAEYNFAIMGVWKQISEYLYLRKKDPGRPKDKWIGYMHGINRISIFVFLLCLIILAIKLLS